VLSDGEVSGPVLIAGAARVLGLLLLLVQKCGTRVSVSDACKARCAAKAVCLDNSQIVSV
jgi:hypothetical protein